MIKYNNTTLKNIETIFSDAKITLRYEKGNFNSGFCILEHKNIVLVNKFFDTEMRVQALLDILKTISIDEKLLSEKSTQIYNQIKSIIQQTQLNL